MQRDLPPHQRYDLERDSQLRRQLDEATPSVGAAGVVIGAVILFILGAIYFAPSPADNASVAAHDPAPAPTATISP